MSELNKAKQESDLKRFITFGVNVITPFPLLSSLNIAKQVTCSLYSGMYGSSLPFCHPLSTLPEKEKLLKTGETIIASTKDYDSGSIGAQNGPVKDAFDLYLIKEKSGDYLLVPFMQIQFFFEDSGDLKWTDSEKTKFIDTFKTQIDKVWGNRRIIKTLGAGKKVFIEHRFDTWVGGTTVSENWEVYVKKIANGSFNQSYVAPGSKEVHLDSEDITSVFKGNDQYQRGLVHEFGHMLGLPDEYVASSTFTLDYPSIMNRGETVLDRHNSIYLDWLDKNLKNNNIT
jgi:hypothetical protein